MYAYGIVRRLGLTWGRTRIAFAILAVVWACVVYFLSVWHNPKVPHFGPPNDWANAAHVCMYLGLAFLLSGFVDPMPWISRWRSRLTAFGTVFVVAVTYGALLEVYQGHVGRDPSVSDGLLDALGALVGFLAWYTVAGFFRLLATR